MHQITIAKDALDAKWNEWVLGYGPENQNKFMEWLGMEDPSWRKLMLTMIAVVAVIVAMISALLMLRYRAPTKDAAAVLYQRFARKTGLEPRVGETAAQFAQRARREHALPATSIESVTAAYHDARYGPVGESALPQLRLAVAELSRSRQSNLSAR